MCVKMVIGEKTAKETTLDYHSKHWTDENETILEHFLLKDLSWYIDRPTAQVHCHHQAHRLYLLGRDS